MDSIRAFMERLGRGGCVVLILSKKYFESPKCMFELTEIADANHELRNQVFPLVLPDAGIDDPLSRIKYLEFWETKIDELNTAMRNVQQTNVRGIQEEINDYQRYRMLFDRLATILQDMNVLTIDRHRASDFSELRRAIETRLSD